MIAELLLNVIDRQAGSVVTFRPERCLRSRLRSNACDICLNLCRRKALALGGRGIVFDEKHCTGCMICVAECPNDAFFTETDIDGIFPLIQEKSRRVPLTIACKRSSPLQSDLNIPCIGLLSEPILAGINCAAAVEIYCNVQSCGKCENGHALDLLHERVQSIADKCGRTVGRKVHCLSVDPGFEKHPRRQRRAFLSIAKNSMRDIGRVASSVHDSSIKLAEKQATPGKKEVHFSRFLQLALARLPADKRQERRLLKSYFYTVKANDDCDLCPFCTGMCPTGALKRKTVDDLKQLYFTSTKCSGCGLCVEFCDKKALTLLPGAEGDPAIEQLIA